MTIRAIVVGGRGGIGGAILDELARDDNVEAIYEWSRTPCASDNKKVHQHSVDIRDEDSIATAAEEIARPNLVVVATGMLHHTNGAGPEKSWRSLNAGQLLESFSVNAVGPALVAKHVLPRFPTNERAIFAALSARVGSISDNQLGGWYGYRASKAALNQLIKTLSIELARTRPEAICVAVHPGTVDTTLSRPFQANVPDGQLFQPRKSAQHILRVLDGLGPEDSGSLIAWDGKPIPF